MIFSLPDVAIAISTRDKDDAASSNKIMIRENRYLVLKRKDIQAHLSDYEAEQLRQIAEKVHRGRIAQGKQALECVVVEKDWPEYESTWSAIELRVNQPTQG